MLLLAVPLLFIQFINITHSNVTIMFSVAALWKRYTNNNIYCLFSVAVYNSTERLPLLIDWSRVTSIFTSLVQTTKKTCVWKKHWCHSLITKYRNIVYNSSPLTGLFPTTRGLLSFQDSLNICVCYFQMFHLPNIVMFSSHGYLQSEIHVHML